MTTYLSSLSPEQPMFYNYEPMIGSLVAEELIDFTNQEIPSPEQLLNFLIKTFISNEEISPKKNMLLLGCISMVVIQSGNTSIDSAVKYAVSLKNQSSPSGKLEKVVNHILNMRSPFPPSPR